MKIYILLCERANKTCKIAAADWRLIDDYYNDDDDDGDDNDDQHCHLVSRSLSVYLSVSPALLLMIIMMMTMMIVVWLYAKNTV